MTVGDLVASIPDPLRPVEVKTLGMFFCVACGTLVQIVHSEERNINEELRYDKKLQKLNCKNKENANIFIKLFSNQWLQLTKTF